MSRQQKHAGDGDPTTDSHTDKRIKLDEPAPATHPFENVDYWLQFDDDTTTPTTTTTSAAPSQSSKPIDPNPVFSSWPMDTKSMTSSPFEEKLPFPGTSSTDPNDFNFFFGTPSPDVDDALRSMNIGDAWEQSGSRGQTSQQQQQQQTLFPGLFPPTPNSDDAPISFSPSMDGTPGTQQASTVSPQPYLGEEEKLSLLSLALNLGPLPQGLLPGGNFNFDLGAAGLCRESLSPKGGKKQSVNGKATVAAAAAAAAVEAEKAGKGGKPRVVDRAAHNDIERRYRTNLKCKIAELKEAIPTLSGEDEEGSGGEKGSSKVSKGTVLTKATEYIHQLEERNKQMEVQQQALMRRLQAVEILLDPRRQLAARMGKKSDGGTPAA